LRAGSLERQPLERGHDDDGGARVAVDWSRA
jgi:hypothetical protein